jgi:hypothetical protein
VFYVEMSCFWRLLIGRQSQKVARLYRTLQIIVDHTGVELSLSGSRLERLWSEVTAIPRYRKSARSELVTEVGFRSWRGVEASPMVKTCIGMYPWLGFDHRSLEITSMYTCSCTRFCTQIQVGSEVEMTNRGIQDRPGTVTGTLYLY